MCGFVQVESTTFKGSFCRNEQQAAESVAGIALLELVSLIIDDPLVSYSTITKLKCVLCLDGVGKFGTFSS